MWVIQHVSVPELCEKQPLQHKHVQVAFQRLAQVETFSNEAHYEELEVQTWQAGDEEEKDLAARGVAARSPVFMPENDWNVPLHLSKYARYISRFFFYPRRPRPRPRLISRLRCVGHAVKLKWRLELISDPQLRNIDALLHSEVEELMSLGPDDPGQNKLTDQWMMMRNHRVRTQEEFKSPGTTDDQPEI